MCHSDPRETPIKRPDVKCSHAYEATPGEAVNRAVKWDLAHQGRSFPIRPATCIVHQAFVVADDNPKKIRDGIASQLVERSENVLYWWTIRDHSFAQ